MVNNLLGYSPPANMSAASDAICEQRAPDPMLGRHNEEGFTGLLGMTLGEIEKLREAKIIGNQLLRSKGGDTEEMAIIERYSPDFQGIKMKNDIGNGLGLHLYRSS